VVRDTSVNFGRTPRLVALRMMSLSRRYSTLDSVSSVLGHSTSTSSESLTAATPLNNHHQSTRTIGLHSPNRSRQLETQPCRSFQKLQRSCQRITMSHPPRHHILRRVTETRALSPSASCPSTTLCRKHLHARENSGHVTKQDKDPTTSQESGCDVSRVTKSKPQTMSIYLSATRFVRLFTHYILLAQPLTQPAPARLP
jgi:hypothetical protein